MENTGSNQPMMNDAQRAIYQQRMDNQYKIIQKNLQKRRLSYGMVTPTDLHRVTKSRRARSLPEKLPGTPEQPSGTPEQPSGTPEQLPGTPEQLPGTPEPSPLPPNSPTEEDYSDDYEVLRVIGAGHFGLVALAEHRVTGELLAIKEIMKPEDPDDLRKLYREVTIMMMLDHPNIVNLIEVMEMEHSIVLVMEYCSGGDLAHYINSDRYRGEEDAKIFFRQIVSAVQYCHENNVTHRDLKPENMLIDANGNIKITDFGLGNIFSPGETLSSFCGTADFTAPEILAGGPYDGTQVDIWSLGVVLYNLVTNDVPFYGESPEELYKAAKENKYDRPVASKQCRKLIKEMLTVDPSKRATMQKIIQSGWLREETTGSSEEESTSRSSASDSSTLKLESSSSSEEAPSARVPWWKTVRNFFRQCCSCFKEPATSE